MLRMLDEPDQNEEDVLMSEENLPDDHFRNPDELNFPWPLINAIRQSSSFFRSCSRPSKDLIISFRLQLFVVFIICVLCLIFGAVFLDDCSQQRMVCVVFIVQGACGLYVVLIQVWAIASGWTSTKLLQLPSEDRRAIWYLIASAHLVTIFCLMWFFIGHIWFILIMNNKYGGCSEVLGQFTRVILVIQYIAGLWILLCRVWNSPKALEWFYRRIQQRLVQFSPETDKSVGEECGDTTDEKIETNPTI